MIIPPTILATAGKWLTKVAIAAIPILADKVINLFTKEKNPLPPPPPPLPTLPPEDEPKPRNDFNAILEKYRRETVRSGKHFEEKLVELGKSVIAELTKPLLADDKINKDDIKDFESRCERALGRIKGVVQDKIYSKINLSNSEFESILKRGDKGKINDFINEVTQNAFESLGDSFKESIIDNVNEIIKDLRTQLVIQQNLTASQLKTLETYKDTSEVAKKQERQAELALIIAKLVAVKRALQG